MKIDLYDHFKTLNPGKYFLIGAIVGPKTTGEVERLFKIIKNLRKCKKKSNFHSKIMTEQMCRFGRTRWAEMSAQNATTFHFGPF